MAAKLKWGNAVCNSSGARPSSFGASTATYFAVCSQRPGDSSQTRALTVIFLYGGYFLICELTDMQFKRRCLVLRIVSGETEGRGVM